MSESKKVGDDYRGTICMDLKDEKELQLVREHLGYELSSKHLNYFCIHRYGEEMVDEARKDSLSEFLLKYVKDPRPIFSVFHRTIAENRNGPSFSSTIQKT